MNRKGRTEVLTVRVTPEVRELINAELEEKGQALSEWFSRLILEKYRTQNPALKIIARK